HRGAQGKAVDQGVDGKTHERCQPRGTQMMVVPAMDLAGLVLLAPVDEDVALQRKEKDEAGERPGQRLDPAPVDRLREHVEEGRAQHHAGGEREQKMRPILEAWQKDGKSRARQRGDRDECGVEKKDRRGVQARLLAGAERSPSFASLRASVLRWIPRSSAAAPTLPARSSATRKSARSTCATTVSQRSGKVSPPSRSRSEENFSAHNSSIERSATSRPRPSREDWRRSPWTSRGSTTARSGSRSLASRPASPGATRST